MIRFAATLLLTAACVAEKGDPSRSPYVGLESRDIKALSPEDVRALRAGEGMGYALAAELNGYPGPRHVLDLADSLGLTGDQRQSIERVHAEMKARAVELGVGVVAAEAELDSRFASRTITPEVLRARVAEIARLEGELRATHLEAHLATRSVLSDEQIARYDALRGYARGEAGTAGHTHE